MAETEVIVTKFEADLTDLDKGVQQYEAALGGAAKASDNLDKKTTELSGSVGKLAPKFEVVKGASDRTVKSIASLREEIKKIEASKVKLIDPAAIANANQRIGVLKKELAGLEKAGAGAGKSSKDLFGGIAQGAQQAIPGVGGIGSAFSGLLGPIGAAAAAAAGGLLAIAKNTDAGKTAIEGAGIGFSSTFDRITGVVKSAGEGLKKFFDDTVGQSEVASTAMRVFAGVVSLGISELIRDDQEFGKGIAEALDGLEEKQLGVNEAAAQNEVIIRRNLSALRDTTKPVEERLRLADEITAAEKITLDLKVKQLKAEYDILSAQAARQQVQKGEIDDEIAKQLSDTRVAILSAQAESIGLTERVAARRAGIVQQEEEKKRSEIEKTKAAREKAVAEEKKLAEARAQAQAKLDGIADSIAAEQLARTQTEAEKEVTATEAKFAALVKATEEGFAKLREASAPKDQAALFQKEADQILAIDAAKNAELAANAQARAAATAKTQEANIEQLRQSLLTETQVQQEAILKQLDADLLLSEQTFATQAERDAFRVEATRQAQEEITAIVVQETEKQLAAQQQLADAELALQQTKFDAAATAGQLIQQIGEDNLAAQIAGLTVEKGAAIAGVIVQTQAGIAAAAAAAAAIPPVLPPGVPNPAFPIAQALSAAQIAKLKIGAGINIATILAQAITGAYTGEERVGVNERPQLPGTRDRFLRRVHKNEGIVDADTNMAFLPEINTMRKGRKAYDDMIYREHIAPAIAALGYNDMGTVNNFVQSDTGQRIAQSVMLAKFYDANIVDGLKRNERTSKAQVELLAQMVKNTRPNRSRW